MKSQRASHPPPKQDTAQKKNQHRIRYLVLGFNNIKYPENQNSGYLQTKSAKTNTNGPKSPGYDQCVDLTFFTSRKTKLSKSIGFTGSE